MTKAAIAWRWSCMCNSLESIAPRFNASWTKRTKPAPIPKLCAATPPSSWWWTNRQSQHGGYENTFAVTLAANENETKYYEQTRNQRRLEYHQGQAETEMGQAHG